MNTATGSSLFRYLQDAAREWRDTNRDFRLFKLFLDSPAERNKLIDLASSDAKLLMFELRVFAASDRQVSKVRLRHSIYSECMSTEHPLPMNMSFHWDMLILRSSTPVLPGPFAEPALVFQTDKAPVHIFVTHPEAHIEPSSKFDPSGDIKAQIEAGLKESKAFFEKMDEQENVFIFSKAPPP